MAEFGEIDSPPVYHIERALEEAKAAVGRELG